MWRTNRVKVNGVNASERNLFVLISDSLWQWHFPQREQYGDLSMWHLMPQLHFVEEICQSDTSDKSCLLPREVWINIKEGKHLVRTGLCMCVHIIKSAIKQLVNKWSYVIIRCLHLNQHFRTCTAPGKCALKSIVLQTSKWCQSKDI